MRRHVLLLSILIAGSPVSAKGQTFGHAVEDKLNAGFNKLTSLWDAPEVATTVEHPPLLNLDIKRVAFGPTEGDCAGDFVDGLIADFVSNGLEVIDRYHLESILAEHKLSLSGIVDRRENALELGKILGPTALVFATVRRCNSERERLVSGRTYIARTASYFKGSIQIVELATARVHSARSIDEVFHLQNTSVEGFPEYPSEYEAIDQIVATAVRRVHQLLFPWSEVVRLRYYDAKECNLKLAYNLILANDFMMAVEQSQQNLELCQAQAADKPKLLAKAHYNLGMAHFLVGQYTAALAELDRALRLDPSKTTSEAIAECRRAKETARQMDAFESAPALVGEVPVEVATLTPSTAETATATAVAESEKTVEERLRDLEELYKKGLITKAVYEQKMAEILKDL